MQARAYGGRSFALSIALGLFALAGPANAVAAAQIGQTFVPTGNCSATPTGYTVFQDASPNDAYAAPTAGVITSWSYYGQAFSPLPPFKLKVARRESGDVFTVVGESVAQTPAPSTLNTFPTRIPVSAGDVIGFHSESAGCQNAAGPGYRTGLILGDQPPGTTAPFSGEANARLNLSALLEPDADCDGFGDETQDPSINPLGCDKSPPETTITKQPKDKTKKKQATFEFIATEPGSTFLCAVDGAALSACTSPATVKVGKGKHDFGVVAVDAAGNQDATPAEDSWKVKKKKR